MNRILWKKVPDGDNDESINNDSKASSQGDNSSDEDDIDTDMQRVFALINSGFDEDAINLLGLLGRLCVIKTD